MFPVANVPHAFHKYVLYNAKIVDKQEKNDKNEDYNYICYNVYLHYQNVVNKKYGRKEIICKDIARSIRFFRNGFLRHCRHIKRLFERLFVDGILVVNLLGGIAAYCYFPKKPSIRVQTVDMSNDRQLTLF